MIQLSYNDASALAELVSYMESCGLPKGHTATLTVRDAIGRHYATIEVGANGEALLTLAPLSEVRGGIQDT